MEAFTDEPYLNFVAPPECPVFTPSEEEFKDPLSYIQKVIRPIGEKTGIVKIKPPTDWQPPFAIDVDKFQFVPRIQRINELEAKTRIKINFLNKLAKFWELQGCTLKIPVVERKFLDLYLLHKYVQEAGGFEIISTERLWSTISNRLEYATGKGTGSTLKNHYEKIIYPYDLFEAGVSYDPEQVRKKLKDYDSDKDYKPTLSNVLADDLRKHRREYQQDTTSEIDYSKNAELRKLQFFGPGPKAAVPTNPAKSGKPGEEDEDASKPEEKPGENVSKVDTYLCLTCGTGDSEDCMLLCDGCDDAFHTYCLIPPLTDVPKGDWRCPTCVKQVCSKPVDPYGFEQSSKTYTLQTFGEMADQFKSNYFNMPVHMVSYPACEKEYWRLVNNLEEDVVVQYGADVHAMEMGSGFPTESTRHLFPEDEEYITSGWNLNNLPVHEQSVLCHINADISGMKIPWCYVGMCFSSFCWHIEDHWSYSINYMHWGEPKTWYGVPYSGAVLLEDVMHKLAPQLFEGQPDLLHQITTTMNPNILMSHGVPIVRTDQCAGEFVLTFPRAYHAGFNQGYNFAEAVNFCPADWIPIGRGCVEHYKEMKRQCVFSHEELICKLAADPDSLDLPLAAATHTDMLIMVENEKNARKSLLDRGTTNAEREAFELLPDDERQCAVCNTTCFLSAITCHCSPDRLVCLDHVNQLCECKASNHCLRYRYTLDELPAMLQRLKIRAESYDNWASTVSEALEADEEDKLELLNLRELIKEAEEKKFPENDLLQMLITAVSEAEKCANVANQLVTKKVRTRNRQSGEGKYNAKLSLDELNSFYEQLTSLPCIVKEAKLIKDLIDKVTDFQMEAQDALSEETPDSEKIEKLIEFGLTLDVDLPEIPQLKQILEQARWLDDVRNSLTEPDHVTLDMMRKLLESGVSLAPHPAVEKVMGELQELLTISERWEEKARICLQAKPRHVIATLEAIINESKGITAYLPNVSGLKDAVRRARDWMIRVEGLQSSDLYPYLDQLEAIVNKGRPIPVRLDILPQLESQTAAAKSWRERTARTFLKKNSAYTLVEVLSPRADIGIYNYGRNRKKKLKDEMDNNNMDVKSEDHEDPSLMVASFKMAEQTEIDAMRALRARNMEKHRQEDIEAKYCICRKSSVGFMLQCELCKDWFHGTCVPLPKSSNMKNRGSSTAVMQAAKDLKFLCPLCLQSRRPRLETILSLLVSLQKLPVRLPEGESLQCLTERAMSWQDRARQALATSELASALAKLSVLSQKMVEQAAREKTEKIINAELQKAANNPELQGHLASVTQSAFGGAMVNSVAVNPAAMKPELGEITPMMVDNEELVDEISVTTTPLIGSDSLLQLPTLEDPLMVSGGPVTPGMSEHAYSNVSKNSTGTPVSARKHSRKSPLVPRQMEAPILELSDMARAQLEELMMEGDLLEVSLDETQHIWRILQACQSHQHEQVADFQDYAHLHIKPKIEKLDLDFPLKEKKKRKKKRLEGEFGEMKIKKIKEEGLDAEMKKLRKKKIKAEKMRLKEAKMRMKELKENKAEPSFFKIKLENGEEKIIKKVKTGKIIKKKKKPKLKLFGDKFEKPERKKRTPKPKLGRDSDGDVADDDCSAMKCLRPLGDEVNWVQCDQCELWFHLLCVGIMSNEISEDEDYVCYQCRYYVNPTESGSSATSSQICNGTGGVVIKTEPQDTFDVTSYDNSESFTPPSFTPPSFTPPTHDRDYPLPADSHLPEENNSSQISSENGVSDRQALDDDSGPMKTMDTNNSPMKTMDTNSGPMKTMDTNSSPMKTMDTNSTNVINHSPHKNTGISDDVYSPQKNIAVTTSPERNISPVSTPPKHTPVHTPVISPQKNISPVRSLNHEFLSNGETQRVHSSPDDEDEEVDMGPVADMSPGVDNEVPIVEPTTVSVTLDDGNERHTGHDV